MDTNYDIFISCRCLDEQGNISGRDQARLIAKQLKLEGYHPFFDYSEIKDNEFDKVIIPAVENCKVFILVLTKDALNRCKNEDDWVRREIETAIKSGSKVINVSPDNSFNGWPDSMPESLYGIKNIQISEIHFGSLFELLIKKLIEERIVKVIKSNRQDDAAVANHLYTSSFLILYLVLGGICCYFCAESSYLVLPSLPPLMIGLLVIGFFILLTWAIKMISDSMNPRTTAEGRVKRYFGGISLAILYGIFIITCMTHALYYKFNIEEQLQTDLTTTKNYLTALKEMSPEERYYTEISQLEGLERMIATEKLSVSNKRDVLLADSILKESLVIVGKCKDVNYKSIDDEFYYTQKNPNTHIETMMNVFMFWGMQFRTGFSQDFLIMLILSVILCSSATMCFLKALDDRRKRVYNT